MHFPIPLDLQFESDQLILASVEIMLMLQVDLKDPSLSVLVLIVGEELSHSAGFLEARLLFEGTGLLLSPLDERLLSPFLAESIVLLQGNVPRFIIQRNQKAKVFLVLLVGASLGGSHARSAA